MNLLGRYPLATLLSFALVLTAFSSPPALAQFSAITKSPLGQNGMGYGVAWGDYDQDGDPDLYLTFDGPNLLLRNDGGGDFTDVTAPPLDDSNNGGAAAWGDFDNDGDPDLYLVNYLSANRLFRNEGDGTFTDVTSGPLGDTGAGQGAAWADFDRDGDLDLYLVNYGTPNKLFRNEGGGIFVDATSPPLGDAGWGVAVAWGDYDNDGDPDLYVANYGMANKLIRNDGGDAFTALTTGPLGDRGNSMGVAWGDSDNDGDLDLYLSNYGQPHKLLRNDGADVFVALVDGPLGDDGNGTGAGWADYDGDGDLDLYLQQDGPFSMLLQNDQPAGHSWIQIDLIGRVSNRSAIGARVRLWAGLLCQMREVTGGSGYLSQDSATLEFGLGSASVVDSIIVAWPSGWTDKFVQIGADQRLTVTELEAVPVERESRTAAHLVFTAPSPNPCRRQGVFRFFVPRAERVSMAVYDMKGGLVAVPVDQALGEGWHTVSWSGRDTGGRRVSAGVYVARLEAQQEVLTRRIVWLP